jgi:hypothetical protein
MNHLSMAPCGVNCELCLGMQREKNRCVGCLQSGNKPYHCTICSIKFCPAKESTTSLCMDCIKFPCQKIRKLNMRYSSKYGESPIENLKTIKQVGLDEFIKRDKAKWECPRCGGLFCVHRENCLNCGEKNPRFPKPLH